MSGIDHLKEWLDFRIQVVKNGPFYDCTAIFPVDKPRVGCSVAKYFYMDHARESFGCISNDLVVRTRSRGIKHLGQAILKHNNKFVHIKCITQYIHDIDVDWRCMVADSNEERYYYKHDFVWWQFYEDADPFILNSHFARLYKIV